MEKWVGKVAVVTGASVGIGAAIAKSLSEIGMIVVGLARREENIKSLAEVTKGKLYGIKCDLQDQNSIETAFRAIEDKFGGVDVLINNAALLNHSPIMDGQPSEWKKLFDTNILGVSICTKEALKTMRTRGDDGHIIFLNSIAGKMTYTAYNDVVGMYPTSKCAINGLAHGLRIELKNAKSLIGITTLYPGLVHTDMGNSAAYQYLGLAPETDLNNTPPGFLTSKDVSDVVVNVLSLNSRIEIQELSMQCRGMGV